MAYINKELFELQYPHRDITTWPGIPSFTEQVKKFSAQINAELLVSADVCDLDDGTTLSEGMKDIIGSLIEAKLQWLDQAEKADFDGRAEPSVKGTPEIREKLDDLKTTEDEPAYYHILHNLWGGGATL